MLRQILRHTQRSLLFACILLLLCSFERLWRYDSAQIKDSTGDHTAANEEGLQVDHFVFWGGIPAWERSWEAKNPISVGLFKFMTFSLPSRPAATASLLMSDDSTILPPTSRTMTPSSLEDANMALRRQIRRHKRQHSRSQSRDEHQHHHRHPDVVPRTETPSTAAATTEDGSTAPSETSTTTTAAVATEEQQPSEQQPAPKIGFVLHLSSCDRDKIASWQKVWADQVLDQPFLFYILLGATVEDASSCASALEEELMQLREDDMVYHVSHSKHNNERLVMTLQTCQDNHIDSALQGLDEFLYYDNSKAVGRLRSSASIRRFLHPQKAPQFQCAGGQQKPAFCDESVLDCPWFQYAPPPPSSTSEEDAGIDEHEEEEAVVLPVLRTIVA